MLPYALKLVWCICCICGTICTWLVTLAFGAVYGTKWAPVCFCVALTVWETMFCLGIIWRMDPYQMPRAFCVAQAVLMQISVYFVGAICMTFCSAVAAHVLQPKKWGNLEDAFRWRKLYLVPAVAYPVGISAAYLALVFKYDAIQPSDDMHCDATDPLWIRFVAHMFPAMVLTLPILVLWLFCMRRLRRTIAHVRRAQQDGNELPRRIRRTSHAARRSSVASSTDTEFPTFAPLPDPTDKSHKTNPRLEDATVEIAIVDEGASATTSTTTQPSPTEREGSVAMDAVKAVEEDDVDDGATYRLSYREPQPTERVSHIVNVPMNIPAISMLLGAQLMLPVFFFLTGLTSLIDLAPSFVLIGLPGVRDQVQRWLRLAPAVHSSGSSSSS